MAAHADIDKYSASPGNANKDCTDSPLEDTTHFSWRLPSAAGFWETFKDESARTLWRAVTPRRVLSHPARLLCAPGNFAPCMFSGAQLPSQC